MKITLIAFFLTLSLGLICGEDKAKVRFAQFGTVLPVLCVLVILRLPRMFFDDGEKFSERSGQNFVTFRGVSLFFR
jgi:hypothetical protein